MCQHFPQPYVPPLEPTHTHKRHATSSTCVNNFVTVLDFFYLAVSGIKFRSFINKECTKNLLFKCDFKVKITSCFKQLSFWEECNCIGLEIVLVF